MKNNETNCESRLTRRQFIGSAQLVTAFAICPRQVLGDPRNATAKENEHEEEVEGFIAGIQRFAIHDGPGIRTLVYMKGCPLRCLWCSSPHTRRRHREILRMERQCTRCGRCVEACPIEVITLSEEQGVKIDRAYCTGCGQCAEACPYHALELVGNYMTVEDLFQEVNKDRPFYRRSNGGVTVGGGEATMQHEFVTAFLKKCKQHYVHTAIETSGYVEWQRLQKMLAYLDLVYMDIKHMDPVEHKKLTRLPNELILENVKRASAVRPTIIRTPVVPGLNDSDENILATARFVAGLGENLKRYELLPYHQFGVPKYSQLDIEYKLAHVEPPSDDHMNRLKELVESCGVKAQIGG